MKRNEISLSEDESFQLPGGSVIQYKGRENVGHVDFFVLSVDHSGTDEVQDSDMVTLSSRTIWLEPGDHCEVNGHMFVIDMDEYHGNPVIRFL